MIERMYFYGEDPKGSAEGLRGQPKIQQHHTNYGRNERNVPRRFVAGDGERWIPSWGTKKTAGVRFRCRKQAPELPEWVLEKDGENPAWGGRYEGSPGSEWRIRATDNREVQPERRWNGREDSGTIRLRDEPAGHLRADQESVRCRYLAGASEQNQRTTLDKGIKR